MGLSPKFIKARDLPDCWFQMVDLIVLEGRKWKVDSGSYQGQFRYELDSTTAHITHPHVRPLIPDIPSHLNIPPPTTMEYVEEYLPYLMTDQPLKENEQYTYGSRLHHQIDKVIEKFKEEGYGTNQCSMSISQPSDIFLPDPPCLREIQFRIFNDDGLKEQEERELHMSVFFRSNDLFSGFPANLAALTLMQEYIAEEVGVIPGEIIYNSIGLHIYDHSIDLAQLRVS